MKALLSIMLAMLWLHDSFGDGAVTGAVPANVVLVPHPSSWSILKHPTLPALYLGCYAAPTNRNLITFRLNADGSLIPESKRVCDNYFVASGTNTEFNYRVYRPSVDAGKNILYVMAGADSPTVGLANTNNNEIAVLSLDEQGQPTKVLKAFRTDYTSTQYLVGIHCDPTARRLYLTYWGSLGWCELNSDGLPVSAKCNLITYAATCWNWNYVPEWERLYVTYSGMSLRIFKLAGDGLIAEFMQGSTVCYGDSGRIEVSTKFRKLYNLDLSAGQRLVIFPLTKEGRLTSVPRYVPLPGAVGFRCDFAANKLYAWTSDTHWKTYTLNAEGFPVGEPLVSALGCGVINDVFVDEKTGKVYVACTQPPAAKP